MKSFNSDHPSTAIITVPAIIVPFECLSSKNYIQSAVIQYIYHIHNPVANFQGIPCRKTYGILSFISRSDLRIEYPAQYLVQLQFSRGECITLPCAPT